MIKKLLDWLFGPTLPDFVEPLLYYHNQVRKAQQIRPLHYNNSLARAAQKQAEWMQQHHHLGHDTVKSTAGDRIRAEGYKWQHFGETIACGTDSPSKVMIVWMEKESNRKTILDDCYRDVGFGKSGQYWCGVFAKRL